MQEVFNLLPDIILYLVTGYMCIHVFYFVALKESKEDINHILLSSLIIGFIIVKTMNMIPVTISYSVDCIGIVITGIVIGYVFGRVYYNKKFYRILELLKIRSTPNKYIWTDLMDHDYPTYAVIEMKNGISYYGYIYLIEGYVSKPQLTLVSHKKIYPDGTIEKREKEDNTVIIIDSGNAETIILYYDDESNYKSRIKDFVRLHDECGSPTYHLHHPEE